MPISLRGLGVGHFTLQAFSSAFPMIFDLQVTEKLVLRALPQSCSTNLFFGPKLKIGVAASPMRPALYRRALRSRRHYTVIRCCIGCLLSIPGDPPWPQPNRPILDDSRPAGFRGHKPKRTFGLSNCPLLDTVARRSLLGLTIMATRK